MKGMGQPSYRLLTAKMLCMEKNLDICSSTTRLSLSKLTKTIFNVQIVALSKHVTNYGSLSGFLYFWPTTAI